MRGAGEDGDAAGSGGDGDFDDAEPFGFGEGCGFACGAARDEQRNAVGDLPVDVGMEGGFVDGAIRTERCDECGAAALQVHAKREFIANMGCVLERVERGVSLRDV